MPLPFPNDAALLTYGALAGSARVLLPPVVDLPVVRAVRGSMLDRISRSAKVTITAEARAMLVDLEAPTTPRGVAEQSLRWMLSRLLPASIPFDVARNVLLTYAAGALFRRYLEQHRTNMNDPVLDATEARKLQAALRTAATMLTMEQARALARIGQNVARMVQTEQELPWVERIGDALVAGLAELPNAWVESMEETFRKTLDPQMNAEATR